jgi:DNA repair protein RecO (recombination protein O)
LKGIVIKETQYKDNDKIITILTDDLGKVSCIAKGAKKTNSPILASSQYLVYSEFVLYKSSNFYYVNSSSIINMFYNLRIDFDKLQIVFELTRLINNLTDENQDTSKILQLFLNTIYVIEKSNKDSSLVVSTFKIKLFALLGFSPRINSCSNCSRSFIEKTDNDYDIFYNYIDNTFCCEKCVEDNKKRYIKINKSTIIAINYIIMSDVKKIFSFELKDVKNLETFGQVYADTITNGI